MIIKGKSRSGPIALAAHLGNAETNERIKLVETRGTLATDLRGALIEMDAYALGTRCERSLYHAAISPSPPYRLTPEQQREAINALEEKLGLTGHARAIVIHEKHGREHLHAVWSRIDIHHMKAVSDSHNYRRHEEVARELERKFGHPHVQGAHHQRDGVERPDRTPSRAELRQEERTGITGKQVKAEVSELFRKSDGPEAFRAALKENGYELAKGDKRDFVIIDWAGGIHSLARRIDSMKAAQLRDFMAPMNRDMLPSIAEVRTPILDALKRKREAGDEHLLQLKYTRSDDYVTQSRAALWDHRQRQRELDDDNKLLPHQPDSVTRRSSDGDDQPTSSRETSVVLGDIEMTDAMQAKLDRLLGAAGLELGQKRDGPDRQGPASGGGRTRSR